MKIISDNSNLLDEISNDLNRKEIKPTKNFKELEGGMGDVTSSLDLVLTLAPTYATVLLTYLTYRLTQKKNSLHFKYKDGIEVKFDNLSKEELKKKELQVREDIANNKLEYISVG